MEEHNYVNYYAKSTYEKKNFDYYEEESVSDVSEEPIIEEIPEPEPEKSPEVKIEKVEKIVPDQIDVITNIYIREEPYGDKIKKDELDRILASKVIKDDRGWAIVPKGTRCEVYDVFVHSNGSVWYNTRFGYLMGKSKKGESYVKILVR